MLGLFGTLDLAARALQAQQAGVEIAGQNLANINNSAYARQRLVLQASPSVPTGVGPQGTGVQIAAIQQIRDAMLDDQVCQETSVGGYWDAQQAGLQSVQRALGEFLDLGASGIDSADAAGSGAAARGLSSKISEFFNAFQGVASNPSSLTERQSLINDAQDLSDAFNQVSTRLTSISDDLDASVSADVTQANQLFSDIAQLNKEIASAENSGGGTANELRDSRQQKLEALAELVDFQPGTASDGSLTISLNGRTVVSGQEVCEAFETGDVSGRMGVMFGSDGSVVSLTSGSIWGDLAVRDGTLASLREGLDALAEQIITNVNSMYTSGYDLHGNTGADFFTGSSAATMGVNADLLGDPALVQVAGVPDAAGDNQVALALARMGAEKKAGLGNKTFNDSYSLLVTSLGNGLSRANDQVANHALVTSLLLNRRDSVSGVSMEEEMTSLISFQKAYQASSRIVSVVDEMLDTILNMKR